MSGIADVIILVSLEAGVEKSLLYCSDKGTEVVDIAVKESANRRESARWGLVSINTKNGLASLNTRPPSRQRSLAVAGSLSGMLSIEAQHT